MHLFPVVSRDRNDFHREDTRPDLNNGCLRDVTILIPKPASPASCELELELIQSHMTQKPVLRGEVDARALRV